MIRPTNAQLIKKLDMCQLFPNGHIELLPNLFQPLLAHSIYESERESGEIKKSTKMLTLDTVCRICSTQSQSISHF